MQENKDQEAAVIAGITPLADGCIVRLTDGTEIPVQSLIPAGETPVAASHGLDDVDFNTVEAADYCESNNDPKTISDAPTYQSVKKVQALKIVGIKQTVDMHQALLELETIDTGERYADYQVSVEWIAKRGAEVGGVLVIYASGYQSYCPLKEFDAGNVPVQKDATGIMFGGTTPYAVLRSQMLNDEDYAYGWHANIAVTLQDSAGMDHADSNVAATRLMKHLFNVDTAHK